MYASFVRRACHTRMSVSEAPLVRASSGTPQRTVEELSEELGWAWYQWRLFIFVGLCVAADAIEVNLLSFVSVEATKDWQLEEFGEDTISAAVFGGQAVGCAVFGLFADRYGRLPAFLTGVAFVSVFGAASSLTTNLTQLIAMRFGVGVGIGGFTVPFDLLAETCPSSLRGIVLCAVWIFWTFGSVALNVLAAYCLSETVESDSGKLRGWRWLTFLAALPATISLCGIHVIDESPAWLAANGRRHEAKAVILRVAKTNGVKLNENFEVSPGSKRSAGVTQLFDTTNCFRTVCLWTLNFASIFGYYGVVIFLPRIFGASAEDPYNFGALLLSCVGEVLGSLVACYLVQYMERKTLLACSSSALALSIPIVLMHRAPTWAMLCAALVARGAANVSSLLTWLVTPEGYGVEVRATGHSWGNLISRVGGVITTYLGGAQIDDSIKACSYVFTALLMVVIALVMPRGVMTGSGPGAAESSSEANVIYVEGRRQNVDGYGARASTDFRGDSDSHVKNY